MLKKPRTNSLGNGIKRVEAQEWWLWAFATTVTLVLTGGIVSLVLQRGELSVIGPHFQILREWVRGLIILVLLFDVYTTYQHLQLQRMRRLLIEREELFHLMTESVADMIAVVDRHGRRLYSSPSYERILGYTVKELAESPSMGQVHPDDWERVGAAAESAYKDGEGKCLEYRFRHKDGSWRVLESRSSIMRSAQNGECLVIVSRDITERKRAEILLEHRALHDDLTNLPNRALFLDRLQRAIDVTRRHPDFKFAIFLIDIDDFKVFNDSLGYTAGDELLIQISRRLTSSLRCTDTVSHHQYSALGNNPNDTLARPGGDEFAVLAAELHYPSDAVRMAARLQERLANPFAVNGQEITVSASLGIVFTGNTLTNAEDVLRDAEIAMYRAKRSGKACCELFDPAMKIDAVNRLQVETDLRRGLELGEFRVHYQPLVSLVDLHVIGIEALSRWQHPSGLRPPAEFIGVAEETGILLTINRQLLEEACQQLREWHNLYPASPRLCLSINVTPKQFAQADLTSQIAEVLRKTNLSANHLDIEITEEVAMSDMEKSGAVLKKLKALGVCVSIDDFGTGYSCLSRLHRFPVDRLKIDRSFISEMESDRDSYEIVRSIIVLAHNLSLKVVAEGIENEHQMQMLRGLGCDLGQGYLFSAPVNAEKIEDLLNGHAFVKSIRSSEMSEAAPHNMA